MENYAVSQGLLKVGNGISDAFLHVCNRAQRASDQQDNGIKLDLFTMAQLH